MGGHVVQEILNRYDINVSKPVAVALLLGVLFTFYVILNEISRYRARIKGFKGPMGYPIFGNIPQVLGDSALKYLQWKPKYGDLFQVQLGNQPVLIVNSAAKAKEVFQTNSRCTNSRPMFHTFHTVVSSTQGYTIGSSPMSESLKRRRKLAAGAVNKPAVQTYVPHIDLESKEFVRDALERGFGGAKPVDPLPLIRRTSLNLSLTLNWGTRLNSVDDPLFDEIIQNEEHVSGFRSTTSNWQDYVPLLRLNPFDKSKAIATETRQRRDRYLKLLNGELDEKLKKKTYKPCIQANVLTDPDIKLNQAEIMSLSITMLNAGLDTVVSTMAWGVALLATRPDIQKKAFDAIRQMYSEDEILCDPADDQSCEYVMAFVKECLRFFTPLRLSLPRTVETPFVLDGHKVPQGTWFFMNSWACNHDPELYGDPENFRPERFIENPSLNHHSYGLGTRMCLGNLLGNRELYLVFMRLISSFEILEGDEKINADPLTAVEDPAALGVMPHHYKVIFKPRNEKVLKQALANHVPLKTEAPQMISYKNGQRVEA
uniref:ARAD1D34782p n=1 Tax=Blastobotrys adeninivorans TaxID=409370 RepID=A0A060TBU7_BLAAD